MASQPIRRDSVLLLLAIILALGIAHLGTSTMPFQISALIGGRKLSGSEAGLFGFCEIGALAATMVLISPVIHRMRSAYAGTVGAFAAAVANVVLFAASPSYEIMLVLAVMAGCGFGLVFAASVTGGSTAHNPDRVYSIGNGGALVFVVCLMFVLPYAANRFGAMGPFLVSGIVLVLIAPTMMAFSARAELPPTPSARAARDPAVIALVVMWAGYSLGSGALWSFAGEIAKTIKISPETTGAILSATTATGVLGTVLAAAVAGRVPRIPAACVGLLGTGLSCLLMGFASGPASYAIGALTYWVFYMFQYPLFLGIAATLDPEGRVGVLGSGCERFAFAVGAPVAGLIGDYGSFRLLGVVGLMACIGPMPICLPIVARRLAQRQEVAHSAAELDV